MHFVCDDGAGVHTCTDHGCHFIPGFVHFSAVDSFEDKAFEDDFVPVDGYVVWEDA